MNPIDAGFSKMGLDTSGRHVLLCVGPDCCAASAGLETWETLKQRIAAAGIPVLRTKAACLRICSNGPWMLIYPDGVWYGAVTPEKCERIIAEHLIGNTPVTEWIAREHPLTRPGPPV